MVRQAVFFVAFGNDCIDQFILCYESIRKVSDIDVILVTDTDYKNEDLMIGRVKPPTPPPNADKEKGQYHAYFTYRTKIYQLLDITRWDRLWYMDTDFIVKEDIFSKYADSPHTLICKEPGTYISNEHFSGALTHEEVAKDPYKRGINAGIISVPKRLHRFWEFYDVGVTDMIKNVERAWLCEQHVLNMMYIRFNEVFDFKTFEDKDVGFPAKKTDGMVLHYACYKFNEKLKLMQDEVIRGTAKG